MKTYKITYNTGKQLREISFKAETPEQATELATEYRGWAIESCVENLNPNAKVANP